MQNAATYGKSGYFLTQDPKLLELYSMFRKRFLSSDRRGKGFRLFTSKVSEESFLDYGKTLIIKNSGQCLGGALLSVCQKGGKSLLPLELDMMDGVPKCERKKYFIKNMLPNLPLKDSNYGELSRIVLHPNCRDGRYFSKLIGGIVEEAYRQNLDYLFAITDKLRWRRYNQEAKKFDSSVILHDEVDVPMKDDYEGLKMYLINIDIKNANRDKVSYYANLNIS